MSSSSSSTHEDYMMQVLNFLDMDSENEAESSRTRRYIQRDHEEAHLRLMNDYFEENCKYTDENFKRRFRMRRRVFNRIMEDILNYSKHPLPEHFRYFHLRVDARGVLSITPQLKITAALRQLAYGDTPDLFDEYLQMSERTCRESLMHFTKCIIDLYRGYYLADGIYPGWASFVKAFSNANDEKRTYFSKKQAGARKDIERTFGILQGRWHILQQPARACSINVMKRVMYTCIILHNIIVEDNAFNIAENDWVYEPVVNMQTTWIERCETYRRRTKELRDRDLHEGLRSDLVEHLWAKRQT